MAKGLFTIGFTVAEIIAIQAKAKQFLLEGKTLMAWGESGSTATKQFPMTVADTLDECAHALRALDPQTYGRRRRVQVSRIPFIAK
jgi:hypothetical protein